MSGGALANLWNGATDKAKAAAQGLANGAKLVKDKTVQGAQWVGGKAAQGYDYAKGKVQQGVEWGKDKLAEGGLKAARGIADKAGDVTEAGSRMARKANDVYGKVRERFTGKPPQQPCINCTGKDVDSDGALFGYRNGRCGPLTNKGQNITPADIAAAKESGYSPTSNPAIDPKQIEAGKDKEGSPRHTSRGVRDCCAQCLGGKPPKTIYYVNGINTNRTTHCETLKQIGDMTCANVVGIYNATEDPKIGSMSLGDTYQTAQDRALVNQAEKGRRVLAHDGRNPAVDTLSDLIVQETRAGRPPEIMAHSQGGAVTSLALYDANNTLKAGPPGPNSSLEGAKVTSFGSASPSWVKGPQYKHYVHTNDATPMVLGLGDDPANHAKKARGPVTVFSGEPGGPFTKAPPLDKHRIPDFTKYHGIDDQLYLKMYQQENKTCGCGGR